jgi:hypothetical protein
MELKSGEYHTIAMSPGFFLETVFCTILGMAIPRVTVPTG